MIFNIPFLIVISFFALPLLRKAKAGSVSATKNDNMKKNIKITITALFCCFVVVGCKQPKPVLNPEAENDIKFDSIVVNEKYHLLGDSTNPFCTIESYFIFPSKYKDKEVFKKLHFYFIESFFGIDSFYEEGAPLITPQNAMENYIKNYIADYKELESDFITETEVLGKKPSQESWYAYYEMSSNEIIYNKCDILSFTVSTEYYTGGAHGGHGFNNHVLYLKTGEEIDETDIFIDNYQDSLAQIIVSTIALDNDVTSAEELEDIGYFNAKEIYPNGNFYLDETGITYTFNVYEIAPFSLGKTDVFLPYEKIRHLLREESPLKPIAFK